MKTSKKGALNISFAWLFAIIVGMFILFFAIYFSIKFIGTEKTQVDATTAKRIGILLNPLETGFESGKTTILTLPAETRIYNQCDSDGNFGEQGIKVSQKTLNKWSETDVNVAFYNKYIFSDEIVEGKKFYIFSMPFNYPFKVADLMIMTSKEYCFVDTPENVKEEFSNFQENIKMNCSSNSIKICFNRAGCNINVNYAQGYVTKNNEKVYFTGNLMYAAIFSDKKTYECQAKRLMQRTEQLSSIYLDKSSFLRNRCEPEMDIGLLSLKNSARTFESSENFIFLDSNVNEINQQNEISECPLW